MNEPEPIAPEPRSTEPAQLLPSRGIAPGMSSDRFGRPRQPREPDTAEPKQIKIVLHVETIEAPAAETPQSGGAPVSNLPGPATAELHTCVEVGKMGSPGPLAPSVAIVESPSRVEVQPQQPPARLL